MLLIDMDMPSSCMECNLCNKGKVTDYGQYGECTLTNKKVNLMTWNIDADCPLKSADGLVKELHDTCHLGAFEWAIIRKYLGDVRFKEVEDGSADK